MEKEQIRPEEQITSLISSDTAGERLAPEETDFHRHILELARERFEQPQNGSQLLKREDLLAALDLSKHQVTVFDETVLNLGAEGYLHLVGKESVTRPFTFTRLTRKGFKYLSRLEE